MRCWPRRLAIGIAACGALLGGALWLLGRESTLQALVQRVANASGASVTVRGVSGSLYGRMQLVQLVYLGPTRRITADQVEIDWAPWQLFSGGIALSQLKVAALRVERLGAGPPVAMPASLAPPFALELADVRVGRLTLAEGASATIIEGVQLSLQGDARRWQLRRASASTPWGQATASASIDAAAPFALTAAASLSESAPRAGQARITLRAGGNLQRSTLEARGAAGKATGEAALVLAPFAAVPLQALALHLRDIDPPAFAPGLPGAALKLDLVASVDARRTVAGSLALRNEGAPGSIDQQRLPLRALNATLAGSLDAPRIEALLLDLGAAGRLNGAGSMDRASGVAEVVLHTQGLDLKGLHSRLTSTRIAGQLRLGGDLRAQTLDARLADGKLQLALQARRTGEQLALQLARLAAGKGRLQLSGEASLAGAHAFSVKGSAVHFDPSALGRYPAAEINAALALDGVLTPDWTLKARAQIGPSVLFGQPLSGKLAVTADARHLSGVAANFALGQNKASASGSFGAPGERLQWKLDAGQLAALGSDLYGSVTAGGSVEGSFSAPRARFVLDARAIGWAAGARGAANGAVHASGEALLDAAHQPQLTLEGTARGLNPLAFGAPLAGSVNASFDADASIGAHWRAALNVALQPSTLAGAPVAGFAHLSGDARRLARAELELHLGANVAAAKGAFGAAGDQLAWRIDAPQLALLGAHYGGALRANGSLAGSMAAPVLGLTLAGENLKYGAHQLKSVRASASLGPEQLVSDIELADYRAGASRVAAARLQTSGTRLEHRLRLAVRSEDADAVAALRGSWDGARWSGAIETLQNKGRYAFVLQAAAPLRLEVPAGAGPAGLLRPAHLALASATFQLPDGTLGLQSLEKNGPRWRSTGQASGIPLSYLAQYSGAMRENLSGTLALGAQWALELQAGGAPAISGMAHVFREKGDLTVGAQVPVVLGLRQLDLRADVENGALRLQLELDGARAGHARVDASARLQEGRLANTSALKLSASADMGSIAWLAPLSGQPALELDGALKLVLDGAGSVGAPLLNGHMEGEQLALRWAEQGIKLRNGRLRAQLAGDQLQLQGLSFEANQGTLAADGALRFVNGETRMQLKLTAEHLELLARPDRTLVVSGSSTLVRDERHFTLAGKVRAERALIELAPQDRPALSDDVIVLGRTAPGTAKVATPLPLTVDLEAELGDDFHLRGMGIDAELAGSVHLRAAGGRAPRANGSIRVSSGTYAAYGQKLTIERGVLSFSGAYDNPALNILAVRKRPEGEPLSETNVEAGVELRGTALAPVAKLVATPSVPDSDKLAWLVLGHGMDSSAGNEAGMLGAAAGALLGGAAGALQSRLANTLGVDELGLAQAKGLETTVVTVGKRISARAYLSFEQGASTATSLVKLRYKLNPRITLQFQTGTNSALDVLYSWAFD
ncbi:MAG: translocation/assembly module TamB domain-containing protein [Pseudomonadota bacterium]